MSQIVQHGLTKITPEDLASQVEDRIREAITQGEIAGGSRLNQDDLAKRLGVSRSPVRTAIGSLLADGLVDRQSNGVVFVRPLTYVDVEDAFVVREAIEKQAIAELAKNDRADVNVIVDTFARHNRDITQYSMVQRMQADKEFHLSLLEATGNPFLAMAIRPVWPVIERAMWHLLQMDRMHAIAWGEHQALVSALQNNDPASATELLSDHLNDARIRLKSVLD